MSKPKISVDKNGEGGNIFAIIGAALGALRKSGGDVDTGKKMMLRTTEAQSYEEATGIISEYVDIEWED